jgi:hypothetical protein
MHVCIDRAGERDRDGNGVLFVHTMYACKEVSISWCLARLKRPAEMRLAVVEVSTAMGRVCERERERPR